MLKVKTVYDCRQELCDAFRGGKYQLDAKSGYHDAERNTYCAVGAAADLFGVRLSTNIHDLHDRLGINTYQRYQLERVNDESDDESRIANVTACIEAWA